MGRTIGKMYVYPQDYTRSTSKKSTFNLRKVCLRFNHRLVADKTSGFIPRVIAILTIAVIIIGALISFAKI
jgi:hypothetical protein